MCRPGSRPTSRTSSTRSSASTCGTSCWSGTATRASRSGRPPSGSATGWGVWCLSTPMSAVDGESFLSGWPEAARCGRRSTRTAASGRRCTAADYEGQGLTDEQIARIVDGSTPHPGATLTEPAVLARPLSELPAHVHQVPARRRRADAPPWPNCSKSDRWGLVETGHRPLADVLPAARTGPGPARVGGGPLIHSPAYRSVWSAYSAFSVTRGGAYAWASTGRTSSTRSI